MSDAELEPLHHDVEYFTGQYQRDDDPWDFDSSAYEKRKFELTVAALPATRYRRCFEPGCANGALTQRLARRCDELIAYDLLEGPAARARRRTAHLPNVAVSQGVFPADWPDGTGDLVVLSEVAYYLTAEGRRVAERKLAEFLEVGGTVVAVHYLLPTDYPMQGAEVAAWIDGLAWLRRVVTHVEDSFELACWMRTSD